MDELECTMCWVCASEEIDKALVKAGRLKRRVDKLEKALWSIRNETMHDPNLHKLKIIARDALALERADNEG